MASELAAAGRGEEGTLVITDDQTAGRGQRGNRWESEPGKNLTFSVILCPRFLAPGQQFGLTQVASLALKEALESVSVPEVGVKWPNDIYSGTRKIAGILIENSIKGNTIDSSVVGIGLNVNQTEFSLTTATSVQLQTGRPVDRQHLLGLILENIEAFYLRLRAGAASTIEEKYLSGLKGFQKRALYRDQAGVFTGKILGVSPVGKLIMSREGAVKQYDLKEVEFILMQD